MVNILAQLKEQLVIAQAAQDLQKNKTCQLHHFQTGHRVMIITCNMPLSYCAEAPATETNQSDALLS
jgi:hypothetical protein